MEPTKLKYMDQSHLLFDEARVLQVIRGDEDRTLVVLDQTIFYPRGGGQACDQGIIKGSDGELAVESVWMEDGYVYHSGILTGFMDPDQVVELRLDKKRREINSRLHTVGHLIDEVVYACNYPWEGLGAGYFADAAWVDYTGPFNRSFNYKDQIEKELNRLIQAGTEITTGYYPREELEKVCHFVCPGLPKVDLFRVVFTVSKKGLLCGATHVANTKEIGAVKIRKVKHKKGKTVVSYYLVDPDNSS